MGSALSVLCKTLAQAGQEALPGSVGPCMQQALKPVPPLLSSTSTGAIEGRGHKAGALSETTQALGSRSVREQTPGAD